MTTLITSFLTSLSLLRSLSLFFVGWILQKCHQESLETPTCSVLLTQGMHITLYASSCMSAWQSAGSSTKDAPEKYEPWWQNGHDSHDKHDCSMDEMVSMVGRLGFPSWMSLPLWKLLHSWTPHSSVQTQTSQVHPSNLWLHSTCPPNCWQLIPLSNVYTVYTNSEKYVWSKRISPWLHLTHALMSKSNRVKTNAYKYYFFPPKDQPLRLWLNTADCMAWEVWSHVIAVQIIFTKHSCHHFVISSPHLV